MAHWLGERRAEQLLLPSFIELTGMETDGTYGIYAMHTERLRMGLEALAAHEEVRSRGAQVDEGAELTLLPLVPGGTPIEAQRNSLA